MNVTMVCVNANVSSCNLYVFMLKHVTYAYIYLCCVHAKITCLYYMYMAVLCVLVKIPIVICIVNNDLFYAFYARSLWYIYRSMYLCGVLFVYAFIMVYVAVYTCICGVFNASHIYTIIYGVCRGICMWSVSWLYISCGVFRGSYVRLLLYMLLYISGLFHGLHAW